MRSSSSILKLRTRPSPLVAIRSGVRVVSVRFAPVRPLSYDRVSTAVDIVILLRENRVRDRASSWHLVSGVPNRITIGRLSKANLRRQDQKGPTEPTGPERN